MSDPTLKRTRVKIAYTASDGFRMDFDAKGGKGSTRASTGDEVPPQEALLAGIQELARLCELFGFGEESRTRMFDAQRAVRAFLEDRRRKGAAS